ncbi:hypothetical protein TNCV_1222381 [Trichonephila clavipes]|nr:hypothetical protein TNCV_1222381 [Trichonephila clavipes]
MKGRKTSESRRRTTVLLVLQMTSKEVPLSNEMTPHIIPVCWVANIEKILSSHINELVMRTYANSAGACGDILRSS